MLPPEPAVIAGREDFADAQALLSGGATGLGNFYASWYGTNVSDERGSFAVVNPDGGLSSAVGNFLEVIYNGNSVSVYVIGSYTLLNTDIGLTRRAYLSICRLSLDPIYVAVGLISTPLPPNS
jgi:hypothetical protein